MQITREYAQELATQFFPGREFSVVAWRQIWGASPNAVSTDGAMPSDAPAISNANVTFGDGWVVTTTLPSGTVDIRGCSPSFQSRFTTLFGYTLSAVPLDVFRVHYPPSAASAIAAAPNYFFFPSGSVVSNSGVITQITSGRFAFGIPSTSTTALKSLVRVSPYAMLGVVNTTASGSNDFTALSTNYGKLDINHLFANGFNTVDFALNSLSEPSADNYRLFDTLGYTTLAGKSFEFVGWKIAFNWASTSVGNYTVIGG